MSKKIAINGVSNGVEPIGRRLRSRHTPLRRSPRLRSKNHGEVPMGNQPNSKKKPRELLRGNPSQISPFLIGNRGETSRIHQNRILRPKKVSQVSFYSISAFGFRRNGWWKENPSWIFFGKPQEPFRSS
uniref:Uncharacterized protein n=1 Tax=Ananas comosus var. bracteatus TaxID=296719 RepID=A0A6V7PRH4_ANACO|nr:unnamed protein product [Ananas comosus var. bracteatus]